MIRSTVISSEHEIMFNVCDISPILGFIKKCQFLLFLVLMSHVLLLPLGPWMLCSWYLPCCSLLVISVVPRYSIFLSPHTIFPYTKLIMTNHHQYVLQFQNVLSLTPHSSLNKVYWIRHVVLDLVFLHSS